MINKTYFFTALFALLLGVLLLVPFVSRADAPPHLVSYQGHLLDSSGAPLTGTTTITFALYSTALDSTPFWREAQTVTMDHGLFSVLLGSVTPLDPADFNGGQAWLGIRPAGSAELLPRHRISSVPYALYAGNADPTVIQHRVSGSCGNGYAVKAIAANGSVSCNSVGITAIHKGTGIVGSGSTTTMGQATIAVDTTVIQHRVSGSCAVGSSIRAINSDGTVICDPPPAVQTCKVISTLAGDGATNAWITATLSTDDDYPWAFDTMNCWTAPDNYITVPQDGFYEVGGEAHYVQHHPGAANARTDMGRGFRVLLDNNGTVYTLTEDNAREYYDPQGNLPNVGAGAGSTIAYLYANDKLYLQIYINEHADVRGSIHLRYLGQ